MPRAEYVPDPNYVRKVVEAAPSLTEEQVIRLRRIFSQVQSVEAPKTRRKKGA